MTGGHASKDGVAYRNVDIRALPSGVRMVRVLPVFRGWTVDVRLRQFRRVHWEPDGSPGPVEFLEFSSEEGDDLLVEYIKSLSPEDLESFTGFP